MSVHPDPIDERWYETEDSRKDKARILKLYQTQVDNIKLRDPRSPEGQYWQRIVSRVLKRLDELKEEMSDPGFRPALRTIWYDLVAAAAIENNAVRNQKFIHHVTEARHKGIIPPDAFTDETRPELDEGPTQTPEEYAFDVVHNVTKAHRYYEPPRWYGQPYHVIVMCEKLAQLPMLQHILKDKAVDIQIIRGQPSYTVMYETHGYLESISIEEEFRKLKQLQGRIRKKIIILYVGDWDPAGDVIDEVVVDYFDRFGERHGKLDYEFRRVAVLKEHETAFGVRLPSDPDAKVYELDSRGLPKDKNAARMKKRYGVIKQIEVDALTSRQLLPHFKKLLLDAVDDYWFAEIWEKYKDKFTQEAAKREIDKRIKLTALGISEIAPYQKYSEALVKGDEKLKQEAIQEMWKPDEGRRKRQAQLLSKDQLAAIAKIIARELPIGDNAIQDKMLKGIKLKLITMTDKEKLEEIREQLWLCRDALSKLKVGDYGYDYWYRTLVFYEGEQSKLFERGIGGYIAGSEHDPHREQYWETKRMLDEIAEEATEKKQKKQQGDSRHG